MVSYVQVAVTEANAGATSPQTATFGSPNVLDNLICVIALYQENSAVTFQTPTDTLGNQYQLCANTTLSGQAGASPTGGKMFFASNIAKGSNTVSVSFTGAAGPFIAIYAFELNGVNAFDNGAAALDNSNLANTGAFQTNYNNEIIIAATINSNQGTSQGAGYTLIEITGTFADVLEYKIAPTTTGTQDATANLNATQAWGIIAGAFYQKPALLPTDAVFFGIT
jgi:hypothetical protein